VARGPNGEQPLALWADVAYASGSSGSAKRAKGREVIVSNPELSPEFVQRYGSAGSLAGSEAEAQAAVARWPDAILLAGRHATKDSIKATWPGASIIYLAAHHVRDPDAPFLGFVPLAAPAGAPPDAALLEIADVQAMDLSTCRLAVLASCSSGAPYRSAVHPGPSLSDAFLDSGAAAVIRSFWDVGDEETRQFMQTFLAGWHDEDDVAASLGRARRQVMATPEGASPRVWAAWSAEIGRP
jgi:CHAT domain-containing protein